MSIKVRLPFQIGLILFSAILMVNPYHVQVVQAQSRTPNKIFLPVVIGGTAVTAPPPPPPTTTGAVYYVSTSGSDSNPGTASAPFKTIGKGASVLQAGDTLYVRSGTYLLNHSLNITRSGTAAKPITLMTAPGEPSLAIISGDLNGNKIADSPDLKVDAPIDPDYWFIKLSGSYIQFRNFEVQFSSRKGIRSEGSYNVIAGNNIHNIRQSGIWVHGPNNTVENNLVWRVVDSNNCSPSSNPYASGLGTNRLCNGNWDGAIAWGDTSDEWNPAPNAIIRHNTVFHSSGEGLLCMNTEGAIVEDNILYDNWALGIDEDQCANTLIQRNLVIYSADKTWWADSTNPAHGIMLSNEDRLLEGWPAEHDNKIINNIIIGSNLRYWGEVAGSALKNDLIANNTIVQSQGMPPLDIDAPTSPAVHTNTRFANNLILQSSGSLSSVGTLSGLTFDHNLWSRNSSIVTGSGDVIGDPRLIAPTSAPCTPQISHPDAAHPLYEYHSLSCGSPSGIKLTSGSPAIDKGADLSGLGVTVDYFGVKRPQGAAFDIGAHE